MTVPAFEALWSEHDEINQHKRRYRVPQLRQMLIDAGFDVSRVTYCNSALFLPVLATRKGKTWWRRFRGHSIEDHPMSDLAFYPKPVNEALYRILTAETGDAALGLAGWRLDPGCSTASARSRTPRPSRSICPSIR